MGPIPSHYLGLRWSNHSAVDMMCPKSGPTPSRYFVVRLNSRNRYWNTPEALEVRADNSDGIQSPMMFLIHY
jgi:hypothetical protein